MGEDDGVVGEGGVIDCLRKKGGDIGAFTNKARESKEGGIMIDEIYTVAASYLAAVMTCD